MCDGGRVMTVTGEIRADQLGFCQCHEHIMLRPGVPSELNPALRADEVEKSVQEVESYRRGGGDSLVDAQPVGCGRMPEQLRQVARRTGVHLIASTGFHLRRFYPAKFELAAITVDMGFDTPVDWEPVRALCGALAREARAGALLLTHLNPLYNPASLLAEAREAYPAAELACLGERYRV